MTPPWAATVTCSTTSPWPCGAAGRRADRRSGAASRPWTVPCSQMAASPPVVVSSPPMPHSVVVPGTSARSPTPTPAPGPAAILVRVQVPERDRCRIHVAGLTPPVTTGIQIPPTPSGANRSDCCTFQGARNRAQRLPPLRPARGGDPGHPDAVLGHGQDVIELSVAQDRRGAGHRRPGVAVVVDHAAGGDAPDVVAGGRPRPGRR